MGELALFLEQGSSIGAPWGAEQTLLLNAYSG